MFGLHLRFQLFVSCPPSKFKVVAVNGVNDMTANQFSPSDHSITKRKVPTRGLQKKLYLLLRSMSKYRGCTNNPVTEMYVWTSEARRD